MKRATLAAAAAALAVCVACVASAAAAAAPPGGTTIDWVAINAGAGVSTFNANKPDRRDVGFTRVFIQADVQIATLDFAHWYLTPLELHPVPFVGALGGGARAGLRVPLGATGRHELRVGVGAGLDAIVFSINAVHPALALRPHVQYAYNLAWGSIGVGIDGLLFFHFRDTMQGDEIATQVPAGMYGGTLYLRWSFGRRSL